MSFTESIQSLIDSIDQTNAYSQGLKQGLTQALSMYKRQDISCWVVTGKQALLHDFVNSKARRVIDVQLLHQETQNNYPIYLVKYIKE